MVNILRLSREETIEKAKEIEKIRRISFKRRGVGLDRKGGFEHFVGRQDYFFIASDLGKVVGCVFGKKIGLNKGEINTLVVHPAYRRRGIGKTLLRYVHDAMREDGLQVAELTVGAGWDAIYLYASQGYKRLIGSPLRWTIDQLRTVHNALGITKRKYSIDTTRGRIKHHYPGGEDALLLQKDLKESTRKTSDYRKVAEEYFDEEEIKKIGLDSVIRLAKKLLVPLDKFGKICYGLYVLHRREGLGAVKAYIKYTKNFLKKAFEVED